MFALVHVIEQGEREEYIRGISSTRIADLPMCLYGKGREILHRGLEAIKYVSKAQSLLLCSVYKLESQAIDALKANVSLPIYHVGPTIPYFTLQEETTIGPSDINYLQWLNMQPRASVLYSCMFVREVLILLLVPSWMRLVLGCVILVLGTCG